MNNFKPRRLTALGALALSAGLAVTASAEPWKFGVMSDTQWTGVAADPVNNPNNVAVSIIKQINPQFIAAGVKFVVQVGDITENGNPADITVTANARQALYNEGIGFFPLRGNHESSQTVAKPAAKQFTNDFPQTQGAGHNVFGANNFISATIPGLKGLSYSFDYNNARFVLLDQFTRLDGTGFDNNNAMVDQVPWIGTTLSNRVSGTHAFVFSHKQLMGENHMDSLFGSSPAKNTNAQNQFIAALQNTGVRYTLSGHDHVHQRSIITSPDTFSSVQEIICGSDSSKFYTPQATNASGWAGQKYRETSVAQDLYRITYYIFTVDGENVTVDYYASDESFPSGHSTDITPTLHFSKRETFGYSLNGGEFLIPQGQTYTSIQDQSPDGTQATIIAGSNGSTVKDDTQRPLTKAVNTGWTAATGNDLSDTLTLWGLKDIAAAQTDIFALSLSCPTAGFTPGQLASAVFYLAAKDANGNWVNAVNLNIGGTKTFVRGAYNNHTLGSYGVDAVNGNVWAVVNNPGDTKVLLLGWGDLNNDGVINAQDLAVLNAAIRARSTNLTYDLNGNGRVDAADARWLALHFAQ